jgi:hypothetical protein
LGWLLLKLKKYPAAEKELKQAVYLDENFQKKQLGQHMAYCLLEDVREEKKEKKEQVRWRKMGFEKARPKTIDQYKWLIETKKYLAGDIITTGVVISTPVASELILLTVRTTRVP